MRKLFKNKRRQKEMTDEEWGKLITQIYTDELSSGQELWETYVNEDGDLVARLVSKEESEESK